MSCVLQRRETTAQRPALGGCGRSLSATGLRPKFPASREFTGNFCRFWAHSPIFFSIQQVNPKAYSKIPYATEQGIFARLAGNFFAGAGNYAGIQHFL